MRIAIAKATLPLCALLGAATLRTRTTTLVASLLTACAQASRMRTRRRALVASLAAAFALVATASLAVAAAPAQAYYLKNTDFGNFHSFLRFPPEHRRSGRASATP
jgi:hypothetical protein